ncbi:MAG TPA: alanine racemase [Candidatus Angelobacter sp.]|nr:alanine racemase [Candidatus Angelobacter sp.]
MPFVETGIPRAIEASLPASTDGSHLPSYSSWVEIDRAALRHNISQIARLVERPAIVVVKANGYGHGTANVARVAVEAGAAMLGVSSLREALEIRSAGIEGPILILGPVAPGEADAVAEHEFSVVAWSKEQIAVLGEAGRRTAKPVRIHLKVDTGMGRFGAGCESLVELAQWATTVPGIFVEGLSTHLSSSDTDDPSVTLIQIERFHKIVRMLEERKLRPGMVHCANSAAAFRFPEAKFDAVRLGISVYGINPAPMVSLPFELQPTLSWKARILNVQTHELGDPIGYGAEYRCATAGERIAVVGAGYADGFRRIPRNVNQVLVGGERLPIVGRICMQHCMVKLNGDMPVKIGDEVVLLGKQGSQEITLSELAERWGTNEWDVLCGINPSFPRVCR